VGLGRGLSVLNPDGSECDVYRSFSGKQKSKKFENVQNIPLDRLKLPLNRSMRGEAKILSKVIYRSESKLILGQLVLLLPRGNSNRQESTNLLDMLGGNSIAACIMDGTCCQKARMIAFICSKPACAIIFTSITSCMQVIQTF
jgi:hypothetical protein